MRIMKGFRFRVYPTPEQATRLRAWQDALRFLWNLALEQRHIGLARCGKDKRYPTAFDQMLELTALRTDLQWLSDVPRHVCQQLLVELDKAWQRCFRRLARAPRFKRKDSSSLCLTEPDPKMWRLSASLLRFPKLGNLRAVIHRPIEGKPKTCTLREEAGQWFASIVCEIEIASPVLRTAPAVALDRGVVNVIADSDGNIVENPKHMDATAKRLARAQRTVSRRKKGSKNREKAKHRVAVLHRKVRRQRDHLLHNLSARYAKSHGVVVVEKLQIGNMVKANRGLARSILGAGWGRLVEQLRYKQAWSGGFLVEVPAAYSSQTCNACDHVDPASRVSQAEFCCTACGLVEHADVNAAKVLLKRFQTPGSPWCLPVDGSASKGPGRSRKRLRVPKRSAETPPFMGGVDY
jgi:putative transposase